MVSLVGLLPQLTANYELDKNLNRIPQGELVPRHFAITSTSLLQTSGG